MGCIVLSGSGHLNPVDATDEPDRVLEGQVTVEIRGFGAAPLGIASAVFSSTALAYNLGRLEQSQLSFKPTNLIQLPGVEVYRGSLRFTLERRGKRHWSAKEFSVQYSFDDRTRFSEDKVVISDSLHASGEARWRATPENTRRAGRWEAPPGWRPGFRPRIDLRTFEAPSVEDCENPGWAATRFVRTALTPEEHRVTCFELKILVAHPVEATGSSVWTSPIGEVRLDALEGVYRFSGSAVGGELAKGAASMPLPPGTPPETVRAIRSMGELAAFTEQWLGGGIPEVDLNTPWTWERTYRGELRNNSVMVRKTFPILTGATVYETARVGEGPILDIYRGGQSITGKTIDAVVGERLNLEGVVEMADGPVTAWQWDVAGDPIKRFKVHWSKEEKTGKDCEGNDVSVTVRTGVNGYPERLVDTDYKDEAVSFLWWDEGRYRVVVNATTGGRTEEAEVTFDVEEPNVTLQIDIGASPVAGIEPDPEPDPCGRPKPEKPELVVTAGEWPVPNKPNRVIPYSIRIWHDALPVKYWGETQYVQLVAEDGRKLLNENRAIPPWCFEIHHALALDESYPYDSGPQMTDWPGLPVGSETGYTLHLEEEMVFRTWLLYRPEKLDADWVPLRIVDWSWRGGVTWNADRGKYDIDGPRVRVTGEKPADRYPIWHGLARDEWIACEDQ